MQDGALKFKTSPDFGPKNGYADARFTNRFHITEESVCKALSIDNVLSIAFCSYDLDTYKSLKIERRVENVPMVDAVYRTKNGIRKIFSDKKLVEPYNGELSASTALMTGSGNAKRNMPEEWQTTDYIELTPG